MVMGEASPTVVWGDVKKVAAAPRRDQASRRLGLLGVARIKSEASEAISTARKGLMEMTVSIM